MANNKRIRSVCFTLNNYTEDDIIRISELGRGAVYCVFQRERGAEGTPHLQGYIYAQNGRTITAWKPLIGQRAHIEEAKGTHAQNRLYCTKEESREAGTDFIEFGICPQQGKRTDIDAVYALVKRGASELEVADSDPHAFVKYHNGIRRLMLLNRGKRDFKTTVLWWYGSTGSGKSREAAERYPEAYWKMGSNKWWDGYDGQEVVIVDDYRRDLCTFAELLRICDRYPLLIEQKGGTSQFLARTIIFTTPRSPRDTWQGRSEEDLEQLLRRIDEVRLFGEEVNVPPVVPRFNPYPVYEILD